MDDLNKNQIVLLTLLISFVTSIATGIITTSLLQEAPIEVTRNINRIVEKTIETVTPGVISAPTQKEVTTVVVKEEDLIVDSINKNIKSLVRIKEKDSISGLNSFYGIGLVASKDGFIVADRKTINKDNVYTATMSDGTEFSLTPTGVDKQTNFILFKTIISDKPLDKTASSTPSIKGDYVFVPATFGDVTPRLGQTIISVGGEEVSAVSVGRVVSLAMKDSSTGTTTTKYLASIDSDLSTKDLVDGSPAFNLSGDIVGVKLSLDASKSFTPISVLKKELTILQESPKSQ